jgi:hypothetical protein
MSQENPLLKLVGPSLLKHVGTKVSTEDALKGKELVLLYFSGNVVICSCSNTLLICDPSISVI